MLRFGVVVVAIAIVVYACAGDVDLVQLMLRMVAFVVTTVVDVGAVDVKAGAAVVDEEVDVGAVVVDRVVDVRAVVVD